MLKYETIYTILQLVMVYELTAGISWKKSDIIVELQPTQSVMWWLVVPDQSGRGSIACCIYCETTTSCLSFTYNRNTRNCTLFDAAFFGVQGNELVSAGNNYYTDSDMTTTTSTTTTTTTTVPPTTTTTTIISAADDD